MFLISNSFLRQATKIIKRAYSTNISSLSKEDRLTFLRKMALPKSRENPVIFKLDSQEFHSIFNDELRALISLFKEYGHEIRIAGGAVRDLLIGKQPKDIDFATTATPNQMKEMFTAENVRMINVNGEKHGTITPRINDKENFEVTTLRIDVVTDGRHAEVQFTTDWMLDALRRDLTINSMFLGFDGSVYDYFFGYDDLQKRRVAFVGDPVSRIQEDYLRILRYFRFYGKIALEPNNHEEITLKAIRENAKGLENISGERIWMELKKILEGNFAVEILKTMVENGLEPYIGLPKKPNLQELERVFEQSRHHNLNPVTLVSALLYDVEDVMALHARLKFSAFERDLALYVVENRNVKMHPKPLLPFQQQIVKTIYKPENVKISAVEVLKYNNSPYWEELEKWQVPKFPVNGNILKEKCDERGKKLGFVIKELKYFWADNDFNLSVDELLKELPRILDKIAEKKKRK